MTQRQVILAAVVAIVGAAAVLRMAGIGSPVPYIDEPLVVEPALAISWQDPNPRVFYYGSFPFYVFRLATAVSSPVLRIATGREPGMPDYYVICRLVSLVFGVATVAVCFFLGKVLVGELVGVVTAALMAFSPMSIALSRTATVDATVGFWSALAWLGMALWVTGRTRCGRDVAGIATGVAVGTKYNAALLLLPITLIALQSKRTSFTRVPSRLSQWFLACLALIGVLGCVGVFLNTDHLTAAAAKWTRGGYVRPSYIHLLNRALVAAALMATTGLVVAVSSLCRVRWACWIVDTVTDGQCLRPALLAVLTFCLVAPYTILTPRMSIPDIAYQVNKTIAGPRAALTEEALAKLEATAGPAPVDRLYYFRAIKDEWGWPVAGLMLVGFCALRYRRREAFVAFGATVLVVLSMSTGWRYKAPRYLYPLWPPLSLFAALGIVLISARLAALVTRTTRAP